MERNRKNIKTLLKVYPTGTKVFLKLDNKISGNICQISIRDKGVLYEINFLINGDIKNYWLSDSEFICKDNKKLEIGFNLN